MGDRIHHGILMGQNTFQRVQTFVEAFQLTPERMDNHDDWPEWLLEAGRKPADEPGALYRNHLTDGWCVHTLEGPVLVKKDAWVIRAPEGDLWPIADDIFKIRYQKFEL